MKTGTYARLAGGWSLRGWADVPYALVNTASGRLLELTEKGFYVAQACDGLTDFSSLAFLPEHNALLGSMVNEGIAEPCRGGHSIESWRQYRRAENPFLNIIQWCVTGRCNLNCRHCYMESPSGRYGELSFEDMLRIIGQFERANVLHVSLTGGEPFLRKDLLDIFGALTQRRIRVSEIYSNGVLITEEILEGIKGMGLAPHFQISFDGRGSHDYMRGRRGVEEKVIAAIRKIRAAGLLVYVAGNVDRVTVAGLMETYELMRTLDIQAWRLGAPLSMGNWKGAGTDLSLQEQASAYMPLLGRWLTDGMPFELVLGNFLRVPGRGNVVDDSPRELFSPESYDCGSCRENPNLLPDGTLLPCPGYVDSPLQGQMPNLLTTDLAEAWTQSLLRTLAETKKRDLLVRNGECACCEFFGNCGMGCRATALRETGDLQSKDPIACLLWKGGFRQRFHERAGAIGS